MIKQRRDVSNERLKLDRQVEEIKKKEEASKESEKQLRKGVISSYNNQLLYETKMKQMNIQMAHEEEKLAGENQTKQFAKIRQDYEKKFDVIGEKESKIQRAYDQLSPDIQPLAKAEQSRDMSLNKLFDQRYHRHNKDYSLMLDQRDEQRKNANDNAKTQNIQSHVDRVNTQKKEQSDMLTWEKSNLEKVQKQKLLNEQERLAKRQKVEAEFNASREIAFNSSKQKLKEELLLNQKEFGINKQILSTIAKAGITGEDIETPQLNLIEQQTTQPRMLI